MERAGNAAKVILDTVQMKQQIQDIGQNPSALIFQDFTNDQLE